MLPGRILCMLNLFDLFGYNTGSSKISTNRRAIRLINVLQILLAIIFILCHIRISFIFTSRLRWIEAVNQALQFSVTLYAYLLIVLDSQLQRKKHKRFWEIVEVIYASCKCRYVFSSRCYVLMLIEYFFVTNFLSLFAILFNNMPFDPSIIFYVVLIKLCHLRVFYYIFCVKVLNFQLKLIKSKLKLMKNQAPNATTFLEHQLKLVRELHQCVYEMCSLLNDFFGWSQVIGVSFCFYFFLANFNWLLTRFLNFSLLYASGRRIFSVFFFVFNSKIFYFSCFADSWT